MLRPLLQNSYRVCSRKSIQPIESLLSPSKLHQTSISSNRQFHPVTWPFAKIGLKFLAALGSRSARKKLKEIPVKERRKIFQRVKVPLGIGLTLCACNYYAHLETAFFTGRKRYIGVSDQQILEAAQLEEELVQQQNKGNIVSPNSAIHKMVKNIAFKLLKSNQNFECIKNTEWRLTVVHSNERSAFVLPNGHIFVFTGLIKDYVQNEHQLAFILAHEIAHVLLKHSHEKLSKLQGKEVLDIAIVALVFLGLDTILSALMTSFFSPKVTEVLITQPFSRKMETEADELGLMLMAKACYDVREASALWKLVSVKTRIEELGGEPEQDFFSTHPSFEKRATSVGSLTAQAVQIRDAMRCGPLGEVDPNVAVNQIIHALRNTSIKPGSQLLLLKDDVHDQGHKAVRIIPPANTNPYNLNRLNGILGV